MGNVSVHELEPVRENERKELDLSTHVDYRRFCKHVLGECSADCLINLPNSVTDVISLYERANFSFNCLITLPDELPLRLPHLCYLNLSYNKIASLPNSIGLLFHLKEFLLPHNSLETLPPSITRLVKLQKIDLSYNLLEELPENIGKMESLKKLNVMHNKLKSLPKSLGYSDTIEVILASFNFCISQPPQKVCDSGSENTVKFMRQLASGKILAKLQTQLNIFPRVRGNIVQTSIPNPDSARVQYVQIQTQTTNTASRFRTPLLPPYDATQLQPDELKDQIIGLIYGAVIGDALGIGTEFLTTDECKFHYDVENLNYGDILTDEHRVHWSKGDWTSNSDQMLLLLDSILQWAGVVDELEFAKRLLSWKRSNIPELGIRDSYMFSTTINLVLQDDNFFQNPHQVAENIYYKDILGQINGLTEEAKARFVDSGSLPRSLILGVPRFYDLNEVISNSIRICCATHQDPRCIASCVTLSVMVSVILQGKYSLNDRTGVEEIIKIASDYGRKYIKGETSLAEFNYYCAIDDFQSIRISETGKMCHPFKAVAVAFVSLRLGKDFKNTLSTLLMFGGYSSMLGFISGSVLGCKIGFSQLPKHWVEGLNTKNREWLNSKINLFLDMMGLP